MKNKKELSLLISKIKTFSKPKVVLEQYQTDPEIASQSLWNAYLNKDIKNKTIADLGCGTGIFGLGSLVLGAKKVYFVDIDKEALEIAKENKKFLEEKTNKKFNAVFINKNIINFKNKVDVAIQNPPFGVKRAHTDKLFLLKAMSIAKTVYSFHKMTSKDFISRLAKENNFKIYSVVKIKLPLKSIFKFHRKKTYFVDVGLWKLIENFKNKH